MSEYNGTLPDAQPHAGPIKRNRTVQIEDPPPMSPSADSDHAFEQDPSVRPVARSPTNGTGNSAASGLSRITSVMNQHLQPSKPLAPAPNFIQSIRFLLLDSWLNLLCLCIPVSWALHFVWKDATSTQDTIVFIFSFLSIVPLAKMLSTATDELSLRVGETLAGLLNATLGNAVELIVGIIALLQCELQIVSSSLVGSILSNDLLVLGMCFFVGGLKFSEQGFGISASQVNSSLLTISVIAVLLPAAFHFAAGAEIADPQEGRDILALSHGAAVILLFIYGCYLVFQLFSHKELYEDSNPENFKSKKFLNGPSEQKRRLKDHIRRTRHKVNKERKEKDDIEATGEASTTTNGSTLESNGDANGYANGHVELVDDIQRPEMNWQTAIGSLIVVAVIVAVTAEFLVDSINGLTESGHISKEFVGLILLPIVGNAAEHVTAVTSSYRDKVNLAISVAVGSSIQIALFVIPLLVIIGWIAGKPLALLFDPFESIVLFLSILTVNYTVADGRCNWLEGAILMCLYLIIAVTFWYYPGVNVLSVLSC